MKRIAIVFVVGATACFVAHASSAQAPREKIATSFVHANGCHDTTDTFTVGIPNSEHLDSSYQGMLTGIEVHETTANGAHAYRNFAFINGSTAITYQLYAKGAGHWVAPPKVLGVQVGGGWCAGAAGAWEGVDIYAHYKD